MIDEKDKFENTPLHMAATFNNVKVVELLLKNGADVTSFDLSGQNVLHKAARNGNNKVVLAVFRHLDKENRKTNEILKELMEKRDGGGNTPFMLATHSTDTMETFFGQSQLREYVDILLMTPNKVDDLPIHKACRYLFFRSRWLNNNLFLPHYNRSGDQTTVEFLLKHSNEYYEEEDYVNASNRFYETPLFFAAQHGDWPDLVQFLFDM